ncbi:hypothetical protein KZO11_37770 [Streptomyces anulatus]|uniref:hypothetical protein n=1 Tax=Streptomyces anulatus TaxID=1892 RepID=UPI001C5F2E73|nr:hypothetical protein [Streptomyces anulatus]QYA98898.1 hypothetical protein KZO11_37770 [Streptomyces anulatus]
MTTTDPTPPTPSPPPAAAPVSASRRSVLTLAAAMGLLATAGLLYVLVDRPGLREPLEGTAAIIGGLSSLGGLVWAVSRPRRSR